MTSLPTRERGDETALSRRFAVGEEIFRVGDPGHDGDLIKRGNIEVSTTRAGGKMIIAEHDNG